MDKVTALVILLASGAGLMIAVLIAGAVMKWREDRETRRRLRARARRAGRG